MSKNLKDKLLVICGPTATGKTSLGIHLAEKFGGEIVSADSRQVYKGMDIGTGKDLSKFSIFNFQFSIKDRYKIGYYKIKGVKVWLLDVVEPDCRFSVADYVKCAHLVIKDIWKRGKLPILVGGTGFYIKGVVDGIETMGIKPDWELREKLQSYRATKLQSILKEVDPERWEGMSESDRKNPRRLIRAIEVAMSNRNLATRITRSQRNKLLGHGLHGLNVLFIGLTAANKVLYERIDKRVDKRLKQGIIEEIKGLLKKGYNWENSVLRVTIGYKEWESYFEILNTKYKILDTKDIIQKWKYNEHGYARRQMTWFKKDPRIHWVDITDKKWQDKVEELVEKWYHE